MSETFSSDDLPSPTLGGSMDFESARPAEGDAASARTDRVKEFDADTINHPRLGKLSKTWAYRGRDGELLGYVCRFDPPDGRKEILPFTP